MSEPLAGSGASSMPGPVRVPPDVLMQRLPDGESVFLNLATEEYYGLDSTGTLMWEALTEAGDVERAHARLLTELDVEPGVLRRDLEVFVRKLRDRGLLEVADD